jgi:hypothetical protein
MVDRDSLTFLIALELAAKGEVGKNILLKTLWNEPSARTATLVLSALRETELNEANLMRLELLNGKFSEEVDLYLSSILVARGRDNKDMIDKTTSDFKALMVIDDGGDNPPPEVLESLLPLLGSGSKRVDKKMLNTIALSGERTVETMQNIVEGQYPTSIKEQVFDVLYQHGAVSALLDIYRSKALRVEVRQHIEEAIKKSEGDWSLLISQSDLDAESKIKLLLDSEGEQAASAVAEVAMAAEKKAQTKVVKMILDAYPQCGDAIDMMLASSSDDDLKIALLKGLERMGPESGLDGTMSSLSSNNSKVQMYALKNLFSKLDGSDERWATIFKAELSESSAEKVIAKVDPENEAYETIMMDSLYHDSKKVRLAALERMNRTKAFLSGPPMINPLVTDEDAQVRNQLLNTLINDQEPSNPIALIWASQQGSASTRKKMGVALAKLSSDKNIQEELLLAMSEPYDTKIKSQVLSFLDKNNVDVLPKVISLLSEDDPVSVQLFKKTIAQIGDKSKRSIVKEINEVKSLFQRTMLENALKNLKVNYRIDPQTGKYVVQ